MRKAYPYYRVSTDRQGKSGLGLDAQQLAVREFAKAHDLEIVDEFIEIESGKKNNRPILHEALSACSRQNAVLLIAKLDRLGRNVAFISKLMESQVDFIAVDNPKANKLILHIMAAFAEYERDLISKRTKEALAAAKLKGVRLGTNGIILAKQNKISADKFAQTMKPVISELQLIGYTTIRSLTKQLNRRRIPTYYNFGQWHTKTVHNLLHRINCLTELETAISR